MADQVIPMVRSGTLGAVNQSGIRVDLGGAGEEYIYVPETAHLVDCRSYQGFSGSPCFLQFEHTGVSEAWTGPRLMSTTALLGMMIAHFQGGTRVEHAGVGVVLPVEKIRELFHRDDVVLDRQRVAARVVAEYNRKPRAAVADIVLDDQNMN
jgi:hypothetical protein